MVFEGDRNGQLIRYEQFPNMFWAGITGRYTGNDFGSIPLAPYGQVFLGGSEYGPLGRASAGLQYSPVGPLVFLLGLEGSAMMYSFQGTTYISPKLGFTYGVGFRF